MKVRVSYTVEATDDVRRALRRRYGRDGLATRGEVADWYRLNGQAMDDDLLYWADKDPI